MLSSGILSTSEDSGDSNDPLPPPGEMEATGELVPMQRYRSAKRRQFSRGLLLGMCISVAIVVPAMKYWSYRHENRSFVKTPTELSAQKSSGDPLATVPLKASTESTASAVAFGSGNRKKDIAETRRPSILATETGGHAGPNDWQTAASIARPQVPAQPGSSGNSIRQKPSKTPQELWASVQAGNSTAAATLAELYIKGEGVPQNCNQARVLLLVASEKRNAEAIKRLSELDKTGCPPN